MHNYSVNKEVNIVIPKDVELIIRLLKGHGHEAYAVGGCIRDAILGREPKDWDITTSALPNQVKEIFHRTIDTGLQHGTVTVMIHHVGYEVTTYRIDGKYTDNRHPESVEFTSNLVEDLKRRDFTINAMAYNPEVGLVDAFDGISDIKNKRIKCVGLATERFSEDALRMLRAVRFSAQLGFEIEDETKKAIKMLAPNLKSISKERICAEFEKIVLSDNVDRLMDAYRLGIIEYTLPEFAGMVECEQNTKYHSYNVGEHTIKVMQNVKKEHYIRWAALLHDVGKPMAKTTDEKGVDHFYGHGKVGKAIARNILRDLRMDNKTIGIVERLVECHDMIVDIPMNDTAVRRSINRIGGDIYPMFIELGFADSMGKSEYGAAAGMDCILYVKNAYDRIIANGECFDMSGLAVSGRDVIEQGIGPGSVVGDVLDRLLDLVIEEPMLNKREVLIDEIRRIKREMD